MTLYEINKEIETAIEAIFNSVNEETGEVDEALVHILEDLNVQRDEKLENYGCYIKNLTAEAQAIKAEEERLADRRKTIENKVERMKVYVGTILNGEKWDKSSKVAFSFRESKKAVIDDESKIPPIYVKVNTTTTPDKTAIKKAILDGCTVPGAHVEINNNLQIK